MGRALRETILRAVNWPLDAQGYSAGGDGHQRELTKAPDQNGSRSGRFGFRHMGGDRVHQCWRQAIIGLEAEILETRPDLIHFAGLDA